MVRFFRGVATGRGWWAALLAVNFLGSLYGFWWYRWQLAETPVRYWPVVPDSPGSTFLLTLFLGVLLVGRVPGADPETGAPVGLRGWPALLGAVAFASNMKYGLWTATVLPLHALTAGRWTFDDVHLTLSHAGMWVQGLLFLRYYRPSPGAALAAWAWLFFQDGVDYWLWHTHPTLPDEAMEPTARAVALALSLVWGGWTLVQAWWHHGGRQMRWATRFP